MVRPRWVVVTLSRCRAFYALGPRRLSRAPVIVQFVYFRCIAMFFPFVDVFCAIRLLSVVTGLIVHPLSLSFVGWDKIVMVFPHL